MTDLHDLSIADLGKKLRARELTAAALVEHAIGRHQRFAGLNAYKHFDAEAARKQATLADSCFDSGMDLGPLQGIPVSVKDLFGVRGMPIFGGSPKRLPEAFEAEGPVVAALRRQHAPIMGKSHTVEFAYDGLGSNLHWGAPVNPWHATEHRMPGGSSSGAGVSLHEGSAWVALGSDSGGSVRMPASWTGTVGLKLTHGRWSIDGIVPFSPSLDSPGPLCRTVDDAAQAFMGIDPHVDAAALRRALARADAREAVIGVVDKHVWDNCAPGVAEGVKRALDELAKAGARIVTIEVPEIAVAVAEGVAKGNVAGVEFMALMTELLPDWLKTLNPILAARMATSDNPRTVSAIDYFASLTTLKRLGAQAAARLEGVDALACPTIVSTPVREESARTIETYLAPNLRVHHNTYFVNLLGLCALTMPVALDAEKMPVGLQLIGRPRTEERLLTIARAFENVLGNARQRLSVPPRMA
jgi:aspartyl-tRNA(Asn)/glutamyl-tRNA(Gln) amidotransferase subunit A